jgi:hypothetical protein
VAETLVNTPFPRKNKVATMKANAASLLAMFETRMRLEIPLFQRQYVEFVIAEALISNNSANVRNPSKNLGCEIRINVGFPDLHSLR